MAERSENYPTLLVAVSVQPLPKTAATRRRLLQEPLDKAVSLRKSWARPGRVVRMKRAGPVGLMGMLGLVLGGVAWACAGGGYETSWEPEASVGMLSPHNDTRSNFILLMADRYGTKVADPAQMTRGIVPFDFPYAVMLTRLEPPVERGADWAAQYEEQQSQYGLSGPTSDYSYSSDNIGLCHSNRDGAVQFNAALKADAAVPA